MKLPVPYIAFLRFAFLDFELPDREATRCPAVGVWLTAGNWQRVKAHVGGCFVWRYAKQFGEWPG